MIKKIWGFTLSEILIALSVIGVVAVLVLPQLVVGQKAAQSKAQFNTAYSLMAKALADMDSDDIDTDPSKYPTRTFYPVFKNYNRFVVDCGGSNTGANTDLCPSASDYKNVTMTGASARDLLDDGAFVLNNGMMVAIENCKGCTYGANHNIWLVVDVNGKDKRPNVLGYDLFVFQVMKDGEVLPLGAAGTDIMFSEDPTRYCCDRRVNSGCSAGTSSYNGYTCAFFAATDDEYFKKLYRGH